MIICLVNRTGQCLFRQHTDPQPLSRSICFHRNKGGWFYHHTREHRHKSFTPTAAHTDWRSMWCNLNRFLWTVLIHAKSVLWRCFWMKQHMLLVRRWRKRLIHGKSCAAAHICSTIKKWLREMFRMYPGLDSKKPLSNVNEWSNTNALIGMEM